MPHRSPMYNTDQHSISSLRQAPLRPPLRGSPPLRRPSPSRATIWAPAAARARWIEARHCGEDLQKCSNEAGDFTVLDNFFGWLLWGWAHCGHGDFWRGEVLTVILFGSMVDFGAVFNFMIKSACRVDGVQTVLSKLLRGKAWQGMQQGVVGIPVLEIHGMDVDSICTCKREGSHYIIHIYMFIYIHVLHVLPGVSPCLSQIKSG